IQDNCDQTTWLSSHKGEAAVVELVILGQIKDEIPKAKSDKLSVTENCSVVMKNVTYEDVGRYTCRQFNRSGQQQGPDAVVHLSVVYLIEVIEDNTVILICSVFPYYGCEHTVKWLYEGNEKDVEMAQFPCSASVSLLTPHLNQKLLKCNVTDNKNGNTLLCNVGPQSSSKNTGGRNKTSAKDGTLTKQGMLNENKPPQCEYLHLTCLFLSSGYLWFIMVSVGLAALIITVVAVNIWMRTKENRTRMDDNAEHHDEGTVTYENVGEPSASIILH
ncbi:uncharacterized protein LOC114572869, partial [Perca flavescens]|uniref:uncharacterized protein LOC114572869 n=1 Tax=Perca flavescens TaxID=8167 RepID=UPI00106E37D7